MAEKKNKTITSMKEKRTVPDEVKANVKEFANVKKTILKALESGPKAIPQIAKETKLASAAVTYYLMSLRKYGEIEETEEIDEDEYYLYRLKARR
jgi:predicted transcriptional regulator